MSAPDKAAKPSGAHRGLGAVWGGRPPGLAEWGVVPPGDTATVHPYKLASVLLQYPTVALFDGLGPLAEAASAAPRASRPPFRTFLEWLGGTSPDTVARHYVETFDLRRRCALYLTYYRYGDTRKRGMAMLAFKAAYRAAGFEQADGELPDYLPLVLDFAALHPRGEQLLRAHRADLELLLRALRDAESPYAAVVEAVCAQLPALRRPDLARVARFWESGPPGEEVGLEPFAPPEYLEGYPAVTGPGQLDMGGAQGVEGGLGVEGGI